MLTLRNTNDPFLDQIVTCDEKWVLYDNRKRSGQWLDRDEPPKYFPKPMLHQKKIVVTVWWSAIGVIHYRFLTNDLVGHGEAWWGMVGHGRAWWGIVRHSGAWWGMVGHGEAQWGMMGHGGGWWGMVGHAIVYRHALVVDSRKCILEIVDSSTKPGEWSVPESEVARADSVAVVYSVTDEESFCSARSCLQLVHDLRQLIPPIALMANKLDLDHRRRITRNDGETLAKEFGAHYAEVSAAESSSDIEPTFLHLVKQAAGSSSTRCHLNTTPSKSLLSFRNSLSPSAIRRFTKPKNEHCQSSVHGRVSASASGTCETSHINSTGIEYCNGRNSRSKRKGENSCSSRCRSHDDSTTYCKMEILDSDPSRSLSLAPKVSVTTRRKLTPAKKIRPYMPTGRSKRREKSSSITKSFASRTSVNDDVFFPPAKKCFSSLGLPSSCSSRLTLIEDESIIKKPEMNYPAHISRSVDQNLQKIEHHTDFNLSQNDDNKHTTEEKPLTLLQRGRSFIQEAKDRHRRDKDLRLSLRNFGSRSDVSRADKFQGFHIMTPTSFPQSTNRSKKLPTEGKTWVCHQEDEEGKTNLLAEALQVPCPVIANGIPDTHHKSRSGVATVVRDLEPGSVAMAEHQVLARKPVGQSDRIRKFSVFSKTFSGFWARNSMPDLPKATVNIYDKIDSFKKSLKKRSV
ncbi:Transposase type 1 [Trinorchestia longiramus]|nr:Transposase type 1 [Trinorchestia longiramus]